MAEDNPQKTVTPKIGWDVGSTRAAVKSAFVLLLGVGLFMSGREVERAKIKDPSPQQENALRAHFTDEQKELWKSGALCDSAVKDALIGCFVKYAEKTSQDSDMCRLSGEEQKRYLEICEEQRIKRKNPYPHFFFNIP